MYYSYVDIEYVATSFSPARTDLALKLLTAIGARKRQLFYELRSIVVYLEETISSGYPAQTGLICVSVPNSVRE